jgi:electron transfer flavoprotein beta subunit
MKILVCVKQVPDLASQFKPDGNGEWFVEEDLAFRLNEYDEYAVEAAVRLKEQLGQVPDTTVLSIGPDRVVEALKKALAMGCDRAVHVQDRHVHSRDPWQIASVIAAFAGHQAFDVIFTGIQSQDRGSGQVGALVAEQLGYACATTVVDLQYADGSITAKRELEGGLRAVLRFRVPAVLTCQSGLNTPRYPTLPNIMKAKRKEIVSVVVDELLTVDSLSSTTSVRVPERRHGGIVLEGAASDQAAQLVDILRTKTAVLSHSSTQS